MQKLKHGPYFLLRSKPKYIMELEHFLFGPEQGKNIKRWKKLQLTEYYLLRSITKPSMLLNMKVKSWAYLRQEKQAAIVIVQAGKTDKVRMIMHCYETVLAKS